MTEFIKVRPAAGRRVDFACWAVAQDPKVRTVSSHDFAVPAPLFTHMPERLLIGAMVDGHRYISPDEDEEHGDLVGVATEAGFREAAPPDPEETHDPGSAPLDPPAENSDRSDRVADSQEPAGGVACADCGRPFKSDRALSAHRRQAHPED